METRQLKAKMIHRIASLLLVLSIVALIVQSVKAYDSIYDLNQDGVVDLKDVYLVNNAFGSQPGDPDWNPCTDVNGDNQVDLKDCFLVAKHLGYRIFVVPEYWMGTILGSASCFAAFGLLRLFKQKRT